jgi:hypothetical protein
MIFLKVIFSFLTNSKNTRILIFIGFAVLFTLLVRQCEETRKAEWETTRISNNLKASQDTIRNYVDNNGNSAAEIRALTLTLDEANELLKFEKNKTPITIIEYKTKIVEKLTDVEVIKIDTILGSFTSAAIIKSSTAWKNSSRTIKTTVPYLVLGNQATFGEATIDLEQNIFLTASIVRDKKTKEVFVNLSTDYPGTTFNSAKGIMIDQSSAGFKDLQSQNRKTLGLGLHIGYGVTSEGIGPYVGIGLNYTPRFLQW